jgi:hypothetical protein
MLFAPLQLSSQKKNILRQKKYWKDIAPPPSFACSSTIHLCLRGMLWGAFTFTAKQNVTDIADINYNDPVRRPFALNPTIHRHIVW